MVCIAASYREVSGLSPLTVVALGIRFLTLIDRSGSNRSHFFWIGGKGTLKGICFTLRIINHPTNLALLISIVCLLQIRKSDIAVRELIVDNNNDNMKLLYGVLNGIVNAERL